MIQQAVVRQRAHDHAFAQQRVVDRPGGAAQIRQDEVAGGRRRRCRASKARAQSLNSRTIERDRRIEMLVIVERRRGGRERRHRHVERLPHAIQDVGEVRVRNRVADAQSREPVRLRESPRDHEVGVTLEPLRAVRHAERRGVLVVRLVEDHDHLGRHRAQQRIERRFVQPGAGRIVRIGDEHHARPRPDGGDERHGVVAERLRVVGGQAGATRAVAPEACTAPG